MMSKLKTIPIIISAAAFLATTSAPSFSAGMPQIAAPFSAENAVIDTAIPFAIGSHQAEQALRGSFGWATFQEGKVNGTYFRFDPDGYARFSRSPRLDEDVFEVSCFARTLTCTARKNEMTLNLTPTGALQIDIAGLSLSDHVFIDDGFSQMELPVRVLQPLEMRLEHLFTEGGKIIIGRNGQEAMTISLSGFEAVAAYLRWVASGQNHAVLPREWPVPYELSRSMTPKISFNGGQGVVPRQQGWLGENDSVYNAQPLQQPIAMQPQFANEVQTYMGSNPQLAPSLRDISDEISLLRQSLSQQPAQQASTTYPTNWRNSAQNTSNPEMYSSNALNKQISRLELDIEVLQDQIKRDRQGDELALQQGTMAMPSKPILTLSDAEMFQQENPSGVVDEPKLIAFFLNQPYSVEEVPLAAVADQVNAQFEPAVSSEERIAILPQEPDQGVLEAAQNVQFMHSGDGEHHGKSVEEMAADQVKLQPSLASPATEQRVLSANERELAALEAMQNTKSIQPAQVQQRIQPQNQEIVTQTAIKPAQVRQRIQPQNQEIVTQTAIKPAQVRQRIQPQNQEIVTQTATKPARVQQTAQSLSSQNSSGLLQPSELLANLRLTERKETQTAKPAKSAAPKEDPLHQTADFSELLVAELLNDLSQPASTPTQTPTEMLASIEIAEAIPMRNVSLGAVLPKLEYLTDYMPLGDYVTMIMNLE